MVAILETKTGKGAHFRANISENLKNCSKNSPLVRVTLRNSGSEFWGAGASFQRSAVEFSLGAANSGGSTGVGFQRSAAGLGLGAEFWATKGAGTLLVVGLSGPLVNVEPKSAPLAGPLTSWCKKLELAGRAFIAVAGAQF